MLQIIKIHYKETDRRSGKTCNVAYLTAAYINKQNHQNTNITQQSTQC